MDQDFAAVSGCGFYGNLTGILEINNFMDVFDLTVLMVINDINWEYFDLVFMSHIT